MDFFRDTHRRMRFRERFAYEDDEQLKKLVHKYGCNWGLIADKMPGRNKRQVRERWANYLRPGINHDPWTESEERLLMEKHEEFGNQWKMITKFFNNRTDIALKSKYHQLVRKESNLKTDETNEKSKEKNEEIRSPTPIEQDEYQYEPTVEKEVKPKESIDIIWNIETLMGEFDCLLFTKYGDFYNDGGISKTD